MKPKILTPEEQAEKDKLWTIFEDWKNYRNGNVHRLRSVGHAQSQLSNMSKKSVSMGKLRKIVEDIRKIEYEHIAYLNNYFNFKIKLPAA